MRAPAISGARASLVPCMKFVRCLALLFCLGCALPALAQQTPAEKSVWKLERAYWSYVKALDLKSYRALWHQDFVGWPSVSDRPEHKDHITDWITDQSGKGLRLKSFKLEPAASQATADIVITHYWITIIWAGKGVEQPPSTLRITHTWIRVGNNWQIIGGMSSPEPHGHR